MQSRTLSSLRLRWAILSLSCVTMTGVYYSFDIPAALHQQLKDYMESSGPEITSGSYAMNFNLLYSVYSIPNIILPFFGGAIVDQLGAHTSALIFASLTLCGQILFALGTMYKSWNIMFLGRTVYGFGGESITVALNTHIANWFRGKEVALSFGINLAVSRLGSVVNNLISPSLANARSTTAAVWFGVLMNSLSVLSAIGICFLTKKGNRELAATAIEPSMLTEALLGEDDDMGDDGVDGHDNNDCLNSSSGLECPSTLDPLDESNSNTQTHERVQIQSDMSEVSTVVTNNMTCSPSTPSSFIFISQVKEFGIMFWLLSASCIVVYGCVMPFNNIASGVLLERNYFRKPPSGCVLKYPDQCNSGTLAPSGGNPSYDKNGKICVTKHDYQPWFPSSIDYSRDEEENSSWDHNSYSFKNLTENNIDCGDSFWKDACTKEFCDAQSRATEISGRIMSIPYFLSASISPFCGHIVDKIGLRAVIASAASIILILVHISLALLDASPVFPLIGQGLAYTCYAAVIWPSVPLTVPQESVGTAFGALTAIQNIGLSLFPLIIASIYTASGETYVPNVEYFFVACAAVGTFVGVIMNIYDRRDGMLNKVHQNE